MNSEERFRQSLEERLASRNFDFDEQNWEKARQMIDASKKRKRRLLPYIVASFLLGTALLSGLYLLTPSAAPLKDTAVLTPVTAPAPIELNGPPEEPPVTGPAQSPASHPQTTGKEPVKEAPALKVSAPAVAAAETSAPDPAQAAPVTPVKTTPEAPAHNDPVKIAGADPLPVQPVVNNGDVSPVKEEPAPEKHKPVEEPVAPMLAATPGNNSGAADNETPASSGKPENTVVASDIAKAEQNILNTGLPDGGQASAPEPSAQTAGSNPAEDQAAKTEIFQAPVSLEPAAADQLALRTETILPLLAKPDSLRPVFYPFDNDQGQLGKPSEEIVLFSVEAGANYTYGWQNPGVRDASGFNPQIGVNCFNNLRPGVSISYGIHYSAVSKLSYSHYTSRIVRRGLGEESQVTVFTPTKVHYLMAPLRINYTPGLSNTFGIGCNVAYLLNVESDVERYTEKLGNIYDHSINKDVGYTEGFRKYDVQVSAFYRRRLYPNLALNLEVFYGLTDVKDNALFNSKVVERNSGLRLTLVYNVLKK